MSHVVLVVLGGILFTWHLLMTAYVYVDAGKYGMNRRRWALVAFVVPLFGFFAYFFERDERTREDEPDLFAEGPYQIHKSRADDAGPTISRKNAEEEDEPP